MKRIFIIIPQLTYGSPVKGAVALANFFALKNQVTLIILKSNKNDSKYFLHRNINLISLAKFSWPKKIYMYGKILMSSIENERISLSFCLSADILNSFCTKYAKTFSSLRGNLYKNYRDRYGLIGFFIAKLHFIRLKKIKNIISMTEAMQKQVQVELNLHSNIVSNFIDENEINKYRRNAKKVGPINYVFTGRLTMGKRPDLLIDAISKLLQEGHDVEANILGDGPLMNKLSRMISINNLPIKLHGNISNPFELLSDADVFVLPSLTEGVSRSAMEALYLGIPCIMRNTDGNSELINNLYNNGELFNFDNELYKKMLLLGIKSRKESFFKEILLPENFRQHNAAKKFWEIITN